MPYYCQYKDGGSCRDCICMWNGRACVDCKPSQHGHCQNLPYFSDHPVLDAEESPPSSPLQVTMCIPPTRSLSPTIISGTPAVTAVQSPSPPINPQTPTVSLSPTVIPETNIADDIPDLSIHPLPPPPDAPAFTWGDKTSSDICTNIDNAYYEIAKWRRKMGKLFVQVAHRSALDGIALKAAMILPALMLQKPHPASKTKENIMCLERRLKLWKDGEFKQLIKEGQTIQRSLQLRKYPSS